MLPYIQVGNFSSLILGCYSSFQHSLAQTQKICGGKTLTKVIFFGRNCSQREILMLFYDICLHLTGFSTYVFKVY